MKDAGSLDAQSLVSSTDHADATASSDIGVATAAPTDPFGATASGGTRGGTITSTDPASATNNSADSQSIAANTSQATAPAKHSSLAKKFLGVVAGAIVGTPVCMFKRPIVDDKYAVSDLTGNSDKPRAVVPAAALWAPFAGVAGVLEAPFFAANNSLVYWQKPFSKEQFSLVKNGTSNQTEEKPPAPKPSSDGGVQ